MKLKYKVLSIALGITAAVVVSSCSKNPDSNSSVDSTAETTAVTAVTTVTTTASVEETNPGEEVIDTSEKYRLKDKKTFLSCYNDPERVPEIASLGGGKLLATTWKFNSDGSTSTTLGVIDILEDKIVAENTVDGYLTFKSASDSGFIMADLDKNEFCFFDNGLNQTNIYKPESSAGKFSPDGQKYYQVISGKLYCQDVGSQELTRINTSEELAFCDSIAEISSDGKYAALTYDNYIDGVYDKTAAVRLDLTSGNIEILSYELSLPSYSDNNLYSRVYFADENAEKFYCISLSDSKCSEITISDYDIHQISGSDYLVFLEFAEEAYPKAYIACFDENGKCKAAPLNGDGSNEYYYWLVYMPEEELIACCCDKDGDTMICLIEPSLFDYSIEMECSQTEPPVLYNEQIFADYLVSSAIPDCPSHLEKLRNRADELEKQYGIKIYMSSECRNMVHDIPYDCTDDFFGEQEEYVFIKTALDDLEKTLAKYPEGFFRQFKRSTGDGGIRICLTSYIQDGFSAAYASNSGDWYNVVIDIRYNCEMNLAHELWHSTESYITSKDYSLLSLENWQQLNPEGFDYSEEFKEISGGISEYCYSYGGDWYFYDNYSKVNPLEDKARIMEIVMNPDIFPSDDFVSSKHIKNKLDCMNDAVRRTFDTSSWGDDVFWERFAS